MSRLAPPPVRPSTRARSLLGAALLLALLSGPTPGAVGSCGGDPLDRPADVMDYCATRDQLVCVRRSLRKELTAQETDTCRRAAIAACEDRSWSPECQPTERQARACIHALQSFSTLHIAESDLPECSTDALCRIAPAVQPSAPGTTAGRAAPPESEQEDGGAADEEP